MTLETRYIIAVMRKLSEMGDCIDDFNFSVDHDQLDTMESVNLFVDNLAGLAKELEELKESYNNVIDEN